MAYTHLLNTPAIDMPATTRFYLLTSAVDDAYFGMNKHEKAAASAVFEHLLGQDKMRTGSKTNAGHGTGLPGALGLAVNILATETARTVMADPTASFAHLTYSLEALMRLEAAVVHSLEMPREAIATLSLADSRKGLRARFPQAGFSDDRIFRVCEPAL